MGCNPPWGKSELVVVDGAINGHQYILILGNQMLPWAMAVFGRNFVHVQDNTTSHTARDMATILGSTWCWSHGPASSESKYEPMFGIKCQSGSETWMNPPSTVAELNNAVRQAWAAVRPGKVWVLVESMPRRVRALLAARGGHTRY